jgi:hypothetical protein
LLKSARWEINIGVARLSNSSSAELRYHITLTSAGTIESAMVPEFL